MENCIFLLNHDTLIEISGPDALNFMQGQFTCDVREVSETQSTLGAHCNLKGRLHYFFRLFFWNNAYYLNIPKDVASHAVETLKKYALFSKVTIRAMADEMIGIGLSHTTAEFVKNTLNIMLPSEVNLAISNEKYVAVQIPGNRFILYGHSPTMHQIYQQATEKFTTCEESEWQSLNIISKLPNVYQGTIEHWLPHPLRLPELNAVSFRKGCYLGQEIVARTEYLGHVKKHTYTLIINQALSVPLKTTIENDNNEVVGEVMDTAIQNDKTYVLAVVSDDATGGALYCLETQAIVI